MEIVTRCEMKIRDRITEELRAAWLGDCIDLVDEEGNITASKFIVDDEATAVHPFNQALIAAGKIYPSSPESSKFGD